MIQPWLHFLVWQGDSVDLFVAGGADLDLLHEQPRAGGEQYFILARSEPPSEFDSGIEDEPADRFGT